MLVFYNLEHPVNVEIDIYSSILLKFVLLCACQNLPVSFLYFAKKGSIKMRDGAIQSYSALLAAKALIKV